VGKTRLATEALAQAKARGCVTAWVVATQAGASIPFGPLAHLLPDGSAETDPRLADSRLKVLCQAGRLLARQAGGKRMVLAVDDAHLLDDASAALVHQLATTSTAFVVATIQSRQPASDALIALWKDTNTEWLELSPLTESQSADLLEAVLGGQVDGATLYELWRLSQGNAMFLRELVNGGLKAETLSKVDGVWRATKTLPISTRLVRIIEAWLDRLSPDVRAVAELVAVSEPLSLSLLETLALSEDLDALDRAGLLEIVPDPRRTDVRIAHPLHGELLRATTPPLRARTIRRQVAEALEATGGRRYDDLLHLLVQQTEDSAQPPPTP
jgi:hypothetical protein